MVKSALTTVRRWRVCWLRRCIREVTKIKCESTTTSISTAASRPTPVRMLQQIQTPLRAGQVVGYDKEGVWWTHCVASSRLAERPSTSQKIAAGAAAGAAICSHARRRAARGDASRSRGSPAAEGGLPSWLVGRSRPSTRRRSSVLVTVDGMDARGTGQ